MSKKLALAVVVASVSAMPPIAYSQEAPTIALGGIAAVRGADMPIKDAPLTLARPADVPIETTIEWLRETKLRIDFRANTDLRERSGEWEIGGTAQLCGGDDGTGDVPHYGDDVISDDDGVILKPDVTWFGTPIASGTPPRTYHFYTGTAPLLSGGSESDKDYNLATTSHDLCFRLSIRGAAIESQSNSIRIPAADLRKAFAGK